MNHRWSPVIVVAVVSHSKTCSTRSGLKDCTPTVGKTLGIRVKLWLMYSAILRGSRKGEGTLYTTRYIQLHALVPSYSREDVLLFGRRCFPHYMLNGSQNLYLPNPLSRSVCFSPGFPSRCRIRLGLSHLVACSSAPASSRKVSPMLSNIKNRGPSWAATLLRT